MPVARKITQKQVKAGFVTCGWILDFHDQAYVIRSFSVVGGFVNFREIKHTGTKIVRVEVSYYTGNESQYWEWEDFANIKEAVAFANLHKQKAMDETALILGEDFMDRE